MIQNYGNMKYYLKCHGIGENHGRKYFTNN